MNRQSGQALVEWGLSAFVLMLFAFGLLAVGQIVGEDTAVRSAASQAAFAAARAPSAAAAQQYGQAAAAEAIQGTQIKDFQVTIDTGSFQRGSTLTVTIETAPFFGPALSRASGVRSVERYPMFDMPGSTTAAKPMP